MVVKRICLISMKVRGHHTGSIRVYEGYCDLSCISVFFMFSEAGLDLFEGDIVYDEVRGYILLIPIKSICLCVVCFNCRM